MLFLPFVVGALRIEYGQPSLHGVSSRAEIQYRPANPLMSALWSCSGLVDTFISVYIDRWRCTMTRRKRYNKEFKREALRRANENGVTDTLVAEEMGFSTRQLRRWRDEATKHGDDAFPGQGNAHDQEVMLLKRKLKKVEQERDFLKEAAAYFAKESK
jgi:transposase